MVGDPAYNNYGVKDPDPFSEIDLDSGPNQCKLLLDFHLLSSSCTWIVGMCIYNLAEPFNFVLLRLIDTSIGSGAAEGSGSPALVIYLCSEACFMD